MTNPCNTAHAHLHDRASLHCCFACGRYWCLGAFLDVFENDAAFDAHFTSQGVGKGESTLKTEKP